MINRKFKKCLITGITGSGGSYLAEHILSKNNKIKIFGIYRSSGNKNLLKNIIYIKIDVIKKICHYISMNQAGWGASTLTHCLEIGLEIGIGTWRRNGPLVLV